MEKMIEDRRSELAGKMSRFTILKNGKKLTVHCPNSFEKLS